MKKKTPFIICILIAIVLTGCAETVQLEKFSETYGFIGGLWHGFIAPFSFICSLFLDNVAMYAVNNSGGWYDFGFVLGAGILTSGSNTQYRNKFKRKS